MQIAIFQCFYIYVLAAVISLGIAATIKIISFLLTYQGGARQE